MRGENDRETARGSLRGWSFLFPGLDDSHGEVGLRLSASGGVAQVEDEAALRQAVLMLLSTLPGERVMRPDYGCALQRLVFSPNDDTTAGLAIHYVRQALERWEPRIEILRLDAERVPSEPGRLDIVLEYRAVATLVESSLTLPLLLAGDTG